MFIQTDFSVSTYATLSLYMSASSKFTVTQDLVLSCIWTFSLFDNPFTDHVICCADMFKIFTVPDI